MWEEREENFKKQGGSHKQPMTIIQLAQYKKRHRGEKQSSNQVVSRTE
jgi:hypothetical protein